MLEQLKLSNLALSVQAEVDFTDGMICITGETGAGKSLVVDALGLVLGAKADANMVRQGEKQLEVSALFSIGNMPQVKNTLAAYGFLDEVSEDAISCGVVADGHAVGIPETPSSTAGSSADEELVVRRIVTSEGKSKAYVNGHMATLTQLRQLSEHLIAIHGQHASVKLMDQLHQLEIVDNYGNLRPLVSEVNAAYQRYSALRLDLTHLSEQQKQGAQEYKQDRYDLEELKRLDFHEGSFEELDAL